MLCAARSPTRRETSRVNPPFRGDILTVTGFPRSRSRTLVKIQFARSNSKGSSTHHPWLKTVRRKLKSFGVFRISCIRRTVTNACSLRRYGLERTAYVLILIEADASRGLIADICPGGRNNSVYVGLGDNGL